MTEPCEKHELIGCTYCSGKERSSRPVAVIQAEAQFDSRCPGCYGHIGAGERIYKLDEDDPFECESCFNHQMRRLGRA